MLLSKKSTAPPAGAVHDPASASPPSASGPPSAAAGPSSAPPKRGIFSKFPVKALKRIPSAAAAGPRIVARPFKNSAQKRAALFQPLHEGDEPIGTLVVQVHAGRSLVAKDKNGLSDPYVVMRYGQSRVTSPTVKDSLNPVWRFAGERGHQDGVAGEAKLECKLFDCRALPHERVEIVTWDRDRIGSEYLGEISLGLEDWWGRDETKWQNGIPPVGFFDADNKPVWHSLRSSRSRSTVTGELLVQVGFIPVDTKSGTTLSQEQRQRIVTALTRAAEELEHSRRASVEERILLAAPTDCVGTHPADDLAPLGDDLADPDSDSSSDDDDDEDSAATISGEDTDTEFDGASIASDADEAIAAGESPDYFALAARAGPPAATGAPVAAASGVPEQPSPAPAIVVNAQSSSSSAPSASATPPPPAAVPHKRGLGLPGFVKRRFSSQSVSAASTQPPSPGESDLASTTDIDSAASTSGKSRRRPFARRQKTSDSVTGIADDLVEMSLVAGGVGLAPGSAARDAEKSQRRKRKGRKARARADEDGTTDADAEASGSRDPAASKRKKSSRRSKKRRSGKAADAFRFDDDEAIAGLVQIEITGAKDLPRYKNALRTSFDMDPFCVISFGKKVFRTRVIRHSLDPVWEERLWFHVGEAETHWTIGFTVSDWDKISGNDHVGDVAVPLEDLLGTTIQHDERGLYPAGVDGRLVGDDFHVHELPLVMGDKDIKLAKQPKLLIKAKYTPYAALRQQFMRVYARQYDIDDNGNLSQVELFSMLDSLGSTLTKETIDSFFTRHGKAPEDGELSIEEVVLCLEQELRKPENEKRHVDHEGESDSNGEMGAPQGGPSAGAFAEPDSLESSEYEQTDLSSDMKTLRPGTQVVTDPQNGTVVAAPRPHGAVKQPPSRADSLDPSSDESNDGIERVINIKECPLCRKPRLNKKGEVSIVTHLGVCASIDPSKVNRVLVSNFVTASQAQRKFLNKVFAKVLKGSYTLGADSANIIVQDRLTGALQEEKMAVYVRLGIRLMYKGMSSNMEGARIRRLLDSLTKKQGAKYDNTASAREIEPFIRFHNLNMEEVLDPLSSFKTFNEFFYRKLKSDARPVADPDDPRTVVSAADCRAMFFQTVNDATSIWIKGREFTIGRMLGDYYKDKAPEYEGGSLAIFRLAPQDYHRYHSPVDGVMGHHDYITGQYYTVNPMAIRSNVSVYSENVRLVASTDSPVFGEVMSVWVGAMMVASIHMTKQEGEPVKRGEEVGYFAFGGSTIVVLFKPNTVQFDQDLLTNSKHSIETLIRVGMRIGRAVDK
ncbi:uncharacterized protein JCM10292_004753 [Rhodotorula paludigena]|uniref:uncharacterized protein n=1 Tax=Rhodotorula paludigena TaxID=86838 RepID=UPI00317F389A